MKYQIVVTNDLSKLEEGVNKLIEQGWHPHGNLVAVANPSPRTGLEHTIYIHPMTHWEVGDSLH